MWAAALAYTLCAGGAKRGWQWICSKYASPHLLHHLRWNVQHSIDVFLTVTLKQHWMPKWNGCRVLGWVQEKTGRSIDGRWGATVAEGSTGWCYFTDTCRHHGLHEWSLLLCKVAKNTDNWCTRLRSQKKEKDHTSNTQRTHHKNHQKGTMWTKNQAEGSHSLFKSKPSRVAPLSSWSSRCCYLQPSHDLTSTCWFFTTPIGHYSLGRTISWMCKEQKLMTTKPTTPQVQLQLLGCTSRAVHNEKNWRW